MPATPWRVAILTSIPTVAHGYAQLLRALGHVPVAVVVPRSPTSAPPGDFPEGIDVFFPAKRRSLAPLMQAIAPDLGLCTGFSWLIPGEVIDAVPQGIVNGHPSPLPRYRGPFPIAWQVRNGETEIGMTYHLMDGKFDTGNVLAQGSAPLDPEETMETLVPKLEALSVELLPKALTRLAAGDRGDAQSGGEYQAAADLAGYVDVDLKQTAADVHRQVRAWSFVPPVSAFRGPLLDGRRLLRTSLTEVEGAERLECSDGPLWVVESENAG